MAARTTLAPAARLEHDGSSDGRRVADVGPPGAPLQMDEAGALYSVGYDQQSRRRSWNRLDPAPEDARLRGWWPVAARDWRVDAGGRVYVTAAGPDAVAVLRLTATAPAARGD